MSSLNISPFLVFIINHIIMVAQRISICIDLCFAGTINRSTLKSKDKQKVDRTVSTESLATKSRGISSKPELSRSTSVPRDPNKSAGWFKLKSKKSRA